MALRKSSLDGVKVEIVNSSGTEVTPATSAKQDEQTAVLGATADAIVAAGAAGSISAKLRRVTQGLADLLTGIVLGAGTNAIGSTKDNGPHWTVVRTYTESADMTTAAAISAAPTGGQKVIGDDILISSDTAMNFKIQMETSTNVLAKVFIPANGTVQITLRDALKGDAADKKLFGKASVAGNVAITCCQHSEA
jgi:hypothetical protein